MATVNTGPRAGAAVALLAAAALAAGCSGSAGGGVRKTSDPPSTPPASTSSSSGTGAAPSSSPSTTDPAMVQQQTEQTVQAAWLNYWKVYLGLNSYPQTKWPATVAAVAVDPIYGEVINSVRTEQEKLGVVGFGYAVSHPYWPAPPEAGQKKVVMGDCFDGSHAGSKVAKTGKTRTVGKARTNIHATLVQGSDGKWRVMQIEYLKASC